MAKEAGSLERAPPGAPVPGQRGPLQDLTAYWTDAWQRSLLFWDVMRQRGNGYRAHQAKTAPHVLKFQCELVMDGRTLDRPVNYALVRIEPPAGVAVDQRKRPFVVIDPRAGHGPGIGGFKADSEIGVALHAGHACYFIGFLPEPMPGQTIEDILNAEALFLEQVIELHPEAEGKPAVIGNCQAGWALMMLAALRPELFGPILVAGSPLSYWTGVHGENPMRYTGGVLGGSWLTALLGDLGGGKFDGAWLVSNFESMNLANTHWSKLYNVFAKVDTESPRYLEFERWWGGHVTLNAEEMQFIVDELFIGNKLGAGELTTSKGLRIDLRNIRSPILCFCSHGDNITPPTQALGWILDLYESVDDIRAHGQTIVYCVHATVGHLGIFVSSGVAKKEHDEFASNIDLIDALPPGLYEAVITPKDSNAIHAELISGSYLVRFEERDLDAIRALGGNDIEDDRRFATAAKVSEINLALYRGFAQPWVRMLGQTALAEWMPRLHPLRLQYELFDDRNPLLRTIAVMAEGARQQRHPIAGDNPLLQVQNAFSRQIEFILDNLGKARDRGIEMLFQAIYANPLLQALVGLPGEGPPRARPAIDAEHLKAVARRIETLKARIDAGDASEAAIRALVYIRMAEGAADERGLAMLRLIRSECGGSLTLAQFKQRVRDQHAILLLDEDRAVEALSAMLARDPEGAAAVAGSLRRIVEAVGVTTETARARVAKVEAMFASVLTRSGGKLLPRTIDSVCHPYAASTAPRRAASDPRTGAINHEQRAETGRPEEDQ
jgi:hypothetical protein